jgi:hypothetical protein
MILGIVGVMEANVIAKKLTSHWIVAELVMHQRLRKRHDQMRGDGSN